VTLGERLELAIANANARGMRLELGRPIREYADYEPHLSAPRRRDVRPSVGDDAGDPGIPGVITADGKQPPATSRGWTHEQLGFAASGMQPTYFKAVVWCLDMDAEARVYLKYELLQIAVQLKEQEHWPKQFRRFDCEATGLMRCRHRYVEDLCTLALREGAEPRIYGTEEARAKWFGISDRHWRRCGIADGYQSLHNELAAWYASGLRYLKDRLRATPRNHAGSRRMSAQ